MADHFREIDRSSKIPLFGTLFGKGLFISLIKIYTETTTCRYPSLLSTPTYDTPSPELSDCETTYHGISNPTFRPYCVKFLKLCYSYV